MEPVSRKDRVAFFNGPKVSVASIDDEPLFGSDIQNEGGDMAFVEDEEETSKKESKGVDKMNDEEIKIKALNLAVNIAKLMSDVTTEDVLAIAGKVAKFIKG